MKKFSELTEVNISNSVVTYMTYKFLLLLKRPWTEWDAYKLGLIDDKGNLERKPKTKDEKEALDKMTNLVRKIKRILGKYIPNEKLLNFLVTVYLLKETPDNPVYSDLSTKLRSYLSEDENNTVYNILLEHNK